MTRRWTAGLVIGHLFGLAFAAGPAFAQTSSTAQPDLAPPAAASAPPATEAPAAAPKVLDVTAEPATDRKTRYQFVRVGEIVLKLDGDSGGVSLCNARGPDWTCRLLPEERVAFDTEFERLRQEIAGLKSALTAQAGRVQQEIESLKSASATANIESQRQIDELRNELKAVKLAVAPPPPPPAPAPPERPMFDLRMPNAQDYERARAIVENAWRRLVEGVAQVQSDVMRKL